MDIDASKLDPFGRKVGNFKSKQDLFENKYESFSAQRESHFERKYPFWMQTGSIGCTGPET